MDDELYIDVRKIIGILLAHWYWIVGSALVAAAAAFIFTYTQPHMYGSNAVIALTRQTYIPNFDPNYETVPPISLPNSPF